MMADIMDAIITVRFTLSNVCDRKDLGDQTFEDMVRWLIQEEGIFGIVDEPRGEIISVEEREME